MPVEGATLAPLIAEEKGGHMKRACFFIVVLMLAGLFAVSCGKKQAKEIKVGVVQAQTGMFASFGQGGVFGVKAAVDDINKQGGIKVGNMKMPIKLIVVDNEIRVMDLHPLFF